MNNDNVKKWFFNKEAKEKLKAWEEVDSEAFFTECGIKSKGYYFE